MLQYSSLFFVLFVMECKLLTPVHVTVWFNPNSNVWSKTFVLFWSAYRPLCLSVCLCLSRLSTQDWLGVISVSGTAEVAVSTMDGWPWVKAQLSVSFRCLLTVTMSYSTVVCLHILSITCLSLHFIMGDPAFCIIDHVRCRKVAALEFPVRAVMTPSKGLTLL